MGWCNLWIPLIPFGQHVLQSAKREIRFAQGDASFWSTYTYFKDHYKIKVFQKVLIGIFFQKTMFSEKCIIMDLFANFWSFSRSKDRTRIGQKISNGQFLTCPVFLTQTLQFWENNNFDQTQTFSRFDRGIAGNFN